MAALMALWTTLDSHIRSLNPLLALRALLQLPVESGSARSAAENGEGSGGRLGHTDVAGERTMRWRVIRELVRMPDAQQLVEGMAPVAALADEITLLAGVDREIELILFH